MIRRLSRYRVFVRLAVKDAMAYRAQFWGSIGMGLISLLLSYYLWRSLFGGRLELAGVTIDRMMSYLVVSALIRTTLAGSVISYMAAAFIYGSLAEHLLLPVSFAGTCFARSAGSVATALITQGLPVFLAGALFIGVRLPPIPLAAIFLTSLALAFTIHFLLDFLMAQLILLTHGEGVFFIWNLILSFATGALIPLVFFPAWMRRLLFALPFHTVFYTPIGLFLGGDLPRSPLVQRLTGLGFHPAVGPIIEQALWAIGLTPLAWLAWKASSRSLVVQGG